MKMRISYTKDVDITAECPEWLEKYLKEFEELNDKHDLTTAELKWWKYLQQKMSRWAVDHVGDVEGVYCSVYWIESDGTVVYDKDTDGNI